MQFLYVRVVKGKEFAANDHFPHPFVEVRIGNFRELTRHSEKNPNPEWNQVFTVLKEQIQATVIEIAVRDKERGEGDDLMGMVAFDVSEVPTRVPPDSPLAPQWYRLESRTGEKVKEGELMLAVWIGTQADEAFPEAWHMDATAVSCENVANIKSKVYLSPRLWYLRVNVIEAQELQPGDKNRHHPDVFVRAWLGGVALRTKISLAKNTSPSWNEDLMFVVAEPFEEDLVLTVEDKVAANKDEVLGKCVVPLQTVEKRVDFKVPVSRWYGLEKNSVGENGEINVVSLTSRLHLRLSFDGGYHVLDELTQYSSDFKATARQLSKPPIGVLELGILSAQDLTSMKNRDGHGTTDAYCVAKYGQKWIRTRTILSSFNPKWNEQYTWEVFDPCTVITIGVFDNQHLQGAGKGGGSIDQKIGKVRIRLSTLETDRVYTHSYPLIVLSPSGVKKMGEIQLAVRFSCASMYNMLSVYSKPLLPILHYLHPLTSYQVENLRHQATHIVSMRMSRAEPPLRKEVVEYMLDVGSNMWSVRRSKANYLRIGAILSSIASVCIFFNRVCSWRNPVITVLVHFLFLMSVCFPQFILSSVFLYLFMIGVYKYRTRPKHPPHMNISLSQADRVHPDELDEEFDTFPTSKPGDAVKMRYDRLRSIASRLQTLAGDMATQGERLGSLLSWRDPRATALFLIVCLFASMLFYIVPFKQTVCSSCQSLEEIAWNSRHLGPESGMSEHVKASNQGNDSERRGVKHDCCTKTEDDEQASGSWISPAQKRLHPLALCSYVSHYYLNPPRHASQPVIPHSDNVLVFGCGECVKLFIELVGTSPNHLFKAIMPERRDMIRKKLALLLRILHMWESTSSMYSTTSFLSGGSARANLAETMFMAWYLRFSSWFTVKGLRVDSLILTFPILESLTEVVAPGFSVPKWQLSKTPRVMTVQGTWYPPSRQALRCNLLENLCSFLLSGSKVPNPNFSRLNQWEWTGLWSSLFSNVESGRAIRPRTSSFVG
nr:FT-interacting protein 1-like [Ipomoea batatas]